MRTPRTAFPVGLYGMLLFALCWLTLPAVFAPLERWSVGAACVLPRWLAVGAGAPALAADAAELRRGAALAADLAARIAVHDAPPLQVPGAAALRPLVCRVVATERRGGGGQPAELRLDHTYAELEGCLPFVSKGEALLGVLARPGLGVAAADQPTDFARVLLLNHPQARPVYAGLASGDRTLRMLVGPAAAADPAPLEVELWDDPQVAAGLDRSGEPVRTLAFPGSAELPPPGLLIGRTRAWGYAGDERSAPLTIGVYVTPPFEPRALSHVVVWLPTVAGDAAAPAATAVAHRRLPATVWALPGAQNGRHLLATAAPVPDGAAVVSDGRCLGTARGLAFGNALLTSFPASRQRWRLILLPDEPAARPRELAGEVVAQDGGEAWVRCTLDTLDGDADRLPAGELFTGGNGLHCPPGLWLGRAAPHPYERDLLRVTTPPWPGTLRAEVLVGTVGGGP